MKHKLILILSILLFSVNSVFSKQNSSNADTTKYGEPINKRVFSIIPLSLLASGLDLSFEQKVLKNKSIFISFGYFTADKPNTYINANRMDGYKGEFQYRMYLDAENESLSGWYIAPYLQYRQIKLSQWGAASTITSGSFSGTTTSSDLYAQAANIGVITGYQYVSKNKFSFGAFIGGGFIAPINQYKGYAKDIDVILINPYERGLTPRMNFTLGFAL